MPKECKKNISKRSTTANHMDQDTEKNFEDTTGGYK
jgi:hypothetical protein